jgi:hypothetical protein
MELKALFKKERCLIPQSHPECEFEGRVKSSFSDTNCFARTRDRKDATSQKGLNIPTLYSNLWALRERKSLVLDFSELRFERGVMFVDENQWRLAAERRLSGTITG